MLHFTHTKKREGVRDVDNAFVEETNRLDRTCTSSAVLVTESKPMYEKKTIADPANIPFTPKGKYLKQSKP